MRRLLAALALFLPASPAFPADAPAPPPPALDRAAAEPALPVGLDIQDRPYPALRYQRFPGKAPPGPLQWDQIVQGELGSCFFLSTLAAISAARPDLLEGRVRDEGGGAYAVTLYGKDGKPAVVEVDDRLPATRSGAAYFGRGKDSADLRPALFEKAFAKLRGSYSAIDGGDATDAFQALTGKTGRDHAPGVLTDEQLWSLLADAVKKRRPLAASTREFDELKRLTGDEDLRGVIDDHVYAVLGVVKKKGRPFVRLYTPLSPRDAGNKKTDERLLTLELSAFKKYFDAVTVGPVL